MLIHCIEFIFVYLLYSYIYAYDNEHKKKLIQDYDKIKHTYEEIIDTYKDAITKTNDPVEILDFKVKIGDCYFDNKDYESSFECYKNILSQCQNYNKKDEIFYKLCLSLYKQCPQTYDISLKKVEELSNYIEYYKQNFKNGEYSDDILKIEKKIKLLLILNELSIIKYYFENKIFHSAIFCCDIFLKKFKKEYNKYDYIFSEVYILKIKSKYEIIKKILASAQKNKDKQLYHIFFNNLSEMFEMLKNYKEKKEIYNINKKEIDILYDKCYFLLNKFYEPERYRRKKK